MFATAAVATTLCFDWSPSDTGTIFRETAGVDPVIYWTNLSGSNGSGGVFGGVKLAHCIILHKNTWTNVMDMS